MIKTNLMLGDCLEKLKDIPENSIDSIVTDSPYGIRFMGQKWDYSVPSVSIWKECFRVLKPGGHILSFSSPRTYHRMAVNVEDAGFEIRDQIMWVYGSGFPKSHNLKPAHEPIVMARKPLEKKTIVDNVLEYGTGAINIDACRIECNDKSKFPVGEYTTDTTVGKIRNSNRTEDTNKNTRWPANFIHDGSEEWSKYFYCPKANKKDRGEDNIHNTVKPTDLMRYLCRLVTPKNGTVLDPFMGSGSTGKAAVLEGFSFIGIELSEEYLKIAEKRINQAITNNE